MAVRECDNLSADLSAYLDGELPDERARLVAGHLKACDGCRRVVEDLRSVSDAIAQLPRKPAPLSVRTAVERAVSQGATRTAGARPALRLIRVLVGVSSAAAAVGLFAFAGWYAMTRGSTVTPQAPPIVDRGGSRGNELASAPPTLSDGFAAHTGQPRSEVVPAGGVPAGPAIVRADVDKLRAPAAPGDFAQRPAIADDAAWARVQQLGVPIATRRETALDGAETRGMERPAASAGAAVVDVIIAPRDAAEYAAVVRVARAHELIPHAGDELGRAAAEQSAAVADGVPARSPVSDIDKGGLQDDATHAATAFVLELRTESISGLIQSLAREAPDRVDVALRFPADEMSDVQRLLASAAKAPATPAPPSESTLVGGAAGRSDQEQDAASAEGRTRAIEPDTERLKDSSGDRTGGRGQPPANPGEVPPAPKPANDVSAPAAQPASALDDKSEPAPRSASRKAESAANKEVEGGTSGAQPGPANPAPTEAKQDEDAASEKKVGRAASARGSSDARNAGRRLREPAPAPAAPPTEQDRAADPAEASEEARRETSRPAAPAAQPRGAGGGGRGEAEAYRQNIKAFRIEDLDESQRAPRAGTASTQPQLDAAVAGYLVAGVEVIGRRVAQLGESLLQLGTVGAPVRAYNSPEGATAPDASSASESAAALRVRVVVLPPPGNTDVQRAAPPAASRPVP